MEDKDMREQQVMQAYDCARERFMDLGVDVEAAIQQADAIPLSMQCWQGDDVIGFDGTGALTGGLATTGNYPGRARTADELNACIDALPETGVYIHCAQGHGRTGFFACALLLRRGLAATAAEAEARVVAARPGVKLRQAQRAFLMSLAPETADHLPTAEQLNRSF